MSTLNEILLQQCRQYYGVKEIPGAKSNPIIDQMLRSVGMPAKDSIAWCSAFVNHVAGLCQAEQTDRAIARSWLTVGTEIYTGSSNPDFVVGQLTSAIPGDVVILRRGNSTWQGHVGFLYWRQENRCWVLGGNQSNRVCLKTYPNTRILGIRRLTQGPLVPRRSE
jgi:uncharacterized protein (TIGR02594 family)